MTLSFAGLVLGLVALTLVLTALSLRLLKTPDAPGESYSTGARFFLIALRVAIGWHCFVEGMEKFNSPSWSSETYLRESVGPLSSVYRTMAGDRLLAKVTVNDETFPPELDRDWQQYLDTFVSHYGLDDEQIGRAKNILDQRKKDTLSTFLSTRTPTVKASPLPPELVVEMTMQERVAEHQRLLDRIAETEAKFPSNDKAVHAEWKTAKADLAKFRVELKKTIDAETGKVKVALEDVLTSEQKATGPLPVQTSLPVSRWRLLEVSDFLVKYGLIVFGALLMLGLFTRTSCVAMAILLLSFYAAMPPLPGWPEGPRSEGHYVLINKTLIEGVALLALAYIPTGRWAGLDALLLWRAEPRKGPG